MTFAEEENQQENKFLSQTKNITEHMNSIFNKQLLKLMASLLRLKHAQNALKQQKKHNFSRVFLYRLGSFTQVFLLAQTSKFCVGSNKAVIFGRPFKSCKRLEALLFLFLLKSLKNCRHPSWCFDANDAKILFLFLFFHNIFYSPFFLFVQGFWQPLHFFFLLTDLITKQIDSKITSTPNALIATFHQPKISIKSDKL